MPAEGYRARVRASSAAHLSFRTFYCAVESFSIEHLTGHLAHLVLIVETAIRFFDVDESDEGGFPERAEVRTRAIVVLPAFAVAPPNVFAVLDSESAVVDVLAVSKDHLVAESTERFD
ncbi:hypothetical protein [Natronosalvus halobius]|uniref:hypothetical protein n=1 Tax=Natronosalvus halobius TaxID=2953746 RepID=UPI0020A18EF5|nr:hypothetical protein [Natronosalvus halobius]USZ73252.1 hypothetical protein NGM15_08130 [Natronosalvus halobius]